jgi:hypothetical protein
VVGARPANLVSSRVREHYFSSHLIRPLDLPDLAAAAARTASDATAASDMVVDSLSALYGIRMEINKRLLSWVLPGLAASSRVPLPLFAGTATFGDRHPPGFPN